MPLGIPSGYLIFGGVVAGLGAVVSTLALKIGEEVGPELEPLDFLPAPPSVGLPLPRFLYTKPDVVEKLKARLRG